MATKNEAHKPYISAKKILPEINKVIMGNKKGGNVLPILPLGKNSILGGNK